LFGKPAAGQSATPSEPPYDTAKLSESLEGSQPVDSSADEAARARAKAKALPWSVTEAEKAKYDAIFQHMQPEQGRVPGNLVAPVLKRSGLSTETLRDIWNLVDVRQDGLLDADWFAVAMHLAMRTKRGHELPTTIPDELVPPAHR
jgi:hypothetical protein